MEVKVNAKVIGTVIAIIYCNNFPSFCLVDVFFREQISKVYEDNFQLFPAKKEANLDNENDARNFDAFCKIHFYA